MTATITESGTYERLVGFEITDEELDAAKTVAARRLAKDMRVPGFRPGRAPRRVVEAAVGAERLRSEAIDDAIPPKLTELLEENEIVPAVTPSLENVDDGESGINVEIKVTLWPTIDDLPNYKNREIEVESPEVKPDELDDQVGRMLDQYATVEEVDRPATDGDYISIDLSAERDGETVEEASATDLLYEIGSGLLLEGFDDHLDGVAAGDSVTFDGPLPGLPTAEDSDDDDVTFTVVINEVKEKIRPELDDAWVEENTEFDTVSELREVLEQRIGEVKMKNLVEGFPDIALNTLLEETEIEIPDALLDGEENDMVHRFLHRLEEQELEINDYFAATGMDQEAFLADVRQGATRSLKTRILLEAVAAEEGLDVPDDEFDRVVEEAAQRSEDPDGMTKALQGSAGLSARADMLRDKAARHILDNVHPVDENGNQIDLEIATAETIEMEHGSDDVVEGEVVEGEIVTGEIVTGEIITDDQTIDITNESSEEEE